MDTRELIARKLCETEGFDWTVEGDKGRCGRWYRLSDAILPIIGEHMRYWDAWMPSVPADGVPVVESKGSKAA